LLNDIGLNGDAEMIGLSGEVGREVIVLVLLKRGVAEIAPQDSSHAQFMSFRERAADFHNLAVGLI